MKAPAPYDHRWDLQRMLDLGGICPCCKATLRLRDQEAQEALEARQDELRGRSSAEHSSPLARAS